MFDDISSVLQPLPFKVKIFEIGNRIGRPFSITKMEQVARRAYIYINTLTRCCINRILEALSRRKHARRWVKNFVKKLRNFLSRSFNFIICQPANQMIATIFSLRLFLRVGRVSNSMLDLIYMPSYIALDSNRWWNDAEIIRIVTHIRGHVYRERKFSLTSFHRWTRCAKLTRRFRCFFFPFLSFLYYYYYYLDSIGKL